MNFQQQDQFYQVMSRLKANSSSRAASTKDDARVTEMINGLLVSSSKPKEPEITILNDSWEREQSKGKTASVPVNKLKAIHDFIKSNGRL